VVLIFLRMSTTLKCAHQRCHITWSWQLLYDQKSGDKARSDDGCGNLHLSRAFQHLNCGSSPSRSVVGQYDARHLLHRFTTVPPRSIGSSLCYENVELEGMNISQNGQTPCLTPVEAAARLGSVFHSFSSKDSLRS
jgi:hypothetical protein